MRRNGVLLVGCEGKFLDRVRVTSFREDKNGKADKVSGTSLEYEPGKTIDLCVIEGGWARLNPDPMTGAPVFSTRVPPLQIFETNHS